MADDKIENTEDAKTILSEDELDKVSGGVHMPETAAQGVHQSSVHQSSIHQSGVKADIFKAS